jgi:hypothetical protein
MNRTIPPELSRFRERESLRLRRQLWSFRAIAAELGISPNAAMMCVRRAEAADIASHAEKLSSDKAERASFDRELSRIYAVAIDQAEETGKLTFIRYALRAVETRIMLAGLHPLPSRRKFPAETTAAEALRGMERQSEPDPKFGEMIARLERQLAKMDRRPS